jgi:hypothetical protein
MPRHPVLGRLLFVLIWRSMTTQNTHEWCWPTLALGWEDMYGMAIGLMIG